MNIKNTLKHVMASLVIISGLSTVTTGSSQASAFMLSEGQNTYTSGLTYSTANKWFNQNRVKVPSCRSDNLSWNHSYTYGYSYYYNFFASTSLANSTCGAAKVTGIADVQLGIRGRLDIERNGRTWEVALNIPTGYDSQKINRLGYGKFGLWAGVAWSTQNTGWEAKMPSYWEFGTGINYWFGPPATQSKSYIKYSWRLDEDGINRIVLKGVLKLSLQDGRGEPIPQAGNFLRFSGDYDAGTISAKYSHRLSQQWTAAVTIGETVWGRKISASRYGTLSLTYRWED